MADPTDPQPPTQDELDRWARIRAVVDAVEHGSDPALPPSLTAADVRTLMAEALSTFFAVTAVPMLLSVLEMPAAERLERWLAAREAPPG